MASRKAEMYKKLGIEDFDIEGPTIIFGCYSNAEKWFDIYSYVVIPKQKRGLVSDTAADRNGL